MRTLFTKMLGFLVERDGMYLTAKKGVGVCKKRQKPPTKPQKYFQNKKDPSNKRVQNIKKNKKGYSSREKYL